MARVSQYNQGQLASSLVGTPGVDNSGSALASVVAETATANANSLQQVERQNNLQRQQMAANAFGEVGQEFRYIEAKKAAADAKLREMQDAETAAHYNLQLGFQLDSAENELMQNNKMNPKGTQDLFRSNVEDKIDNFIKENGLDQKGYEGIAKAVRLHGLTEAAKKSTALGNWEMDQTNTSLKQKLVVDGVAMQNMAGNLNGDVKQFNDLLEKFNSPEMQNRYFLNYGANAATESQKVQKGIVTNFVSSLITEGNPKLALQYMDKGTFDNVLTPNEKEHLVNAAERENKKQITETNHVTRVNTEALFMQAYLTEDPKKQSDAISKLQSLYAIELAKPANEQDLTMLKEFGSDMRKLATDIRMEKQRKESDARQAQRDQEHFVSLYRQNQRWQDHLISQDNKRELERQRAVYMSPQGASVQSKFKAAMDFVNSNATKNPAQELQEVIKARKILLQTDSELLFPPGKEGHDKYTAAQGAINAKLERLANKGEDSIPKDVKGKEREQMLWELRTTASNAEKMLTKIATSEAPPILHQAFKTQGKPDEQAELNAKFNVNLKAAFDANLKNPHRKAKGQPLSDEEMRKITSKVAEGFLKQYPQFKIGK